MILYCRIQVKSTLIRNCYDQVPRASLSYVGDAGDISNLTLGTLLAEF